MYYLIFLFVLILFLLLKFYLYKKFGFWIYQPVFHYHNIFYWIYPIGIVNKNLQKPNKFCNFYNVITKEYQDLSKNEIEECVKLINNNYFSEKSGKYQPSVDLFSSYLSGNNGKTFVSAYYHYDVTVKDNKLEPEKKIISTMTSRPVDIIINNTKFRVYYVDFLCVDKLYRKDGIAPKVIQTHEYVHSIKNNYPQISLFKREGKLTGIVPLVKYNTYQFNICDLDSLLELNLDRQKKYTLIEITSLNINLLKNFLDENISKFKCCVIADFSNIENLISKKTYRIYGIIHNHFLMGVFFLRESAMYYSNKDDKYIDKSIDLFASVFDNNLKHEDIIDNLFLVCKKVKDDYKYLTVEDISYNYIIIDYLKSKITTTLISPTAYFLYNYINYQLNEKEVIIIV